MNGPPEGDRVIAHPAIVQRKRCPLDYGQASRIKSSMLTVWEEETFLPFFLVNFSKRYFEDAI
jgi:hypothetical protein